MNNELERIWKKAVVAYFKVLFWYLPARLKKSTKNLRRVSRCQVEINWTQYKYRDVE
jgi:hypothetical protein